MSSNIGTREAVDLLAAMHEINGMLSGSLPITSEVKEIARAAIEKAAVSVQTKTESASGKFKMSILKELFESAQEAADWLVQAPIGSDQYERGIRLQLAIERAAK